MVNRRFQRLMAWMDSHRRSSRWIVVLVCLATYIASLWLPALRLRLTVACEPGSPSCIHWPYPHEARGIEDVHGLLLLLNGLLFGPYFKNFAAYANPLFWLGLGCFAGGGLKAARVLLLLALLVSLQTLQVYLVPLPMDEGIVVRGLLLYPHAGFFLWILGMDVPLLLAHRWLEQQRTASTGGDAAGLKGWWLRLITAIWPFQT